MSNSRFTIGQTVTQEMHLWAVPRRPYQSADEPAWTYKVHYYGPDIGHSNGAVYIGKTDATFDVPDGVNLLEACIDNLRDQQNSIRAKAHREVAEIDRQIESMLLLEHQPESAQ